MFSNPEKNVRTLMLPEHAVVADLGAGTGFYSVAMGKLLPRGKVYAVEVQKDYLSKIRHKVREAHLSNIEPIWGNVEKLHGTKIHDAVTDAVIATDVLFQVEDKPGFIAETKRILKPGGKVLLIDWVTPIHGRLEHTVPRAKAQEMFESAGFAQEREIDVGARHYGMILKKL